MYICRIKIQPYEDTVLYLSNLYCFAYFIGIDYPHAIVTIVGSLVGELTFGDIIQEKYGHN